MVSAALCDLQDKGCRAVASIPEAESSQPCQSESLTAMSDADCKLAALLQFTRDWIKLRFYIPSDGRKCSRLDDLAGFRFLCNCDIKLLGLESGLGHLSGDRRRIFSRQSHAALPSVTFRPADQSLPAQGGYLAQQRRRWLRLLRNAIATRAPFDRSRTSGAFFSSFV